MVEAINHPVCPMCFFPHPPGLLNCVEPFRTGELLPGVGMAVVVPSPSLNDLFDMEVWSAASAARLEETGRQIKELMAVMAVMGVEAAPPPPVPDTKTLEKLRAAQDQVRALEAQRDRARSLLKELMQTLETLVELSGIDMLGAAPLELTEEPITEDEFNEVSEAAGIILDTLRDYHRLSLETLDEIVDVLRKPK